MRVRVYACACVRVLCGCVLFGFGEWQLCVVVGVRLQVCVEVVVVVDFRLLSFLWL